MTDKKTTDTEFDAYLEGKSPLSDLYHQSEPDGPGKGIDNAILSAARQEAKKHSSGRGHRWYVPVALAASLVITILVVRVTPLNDVADPDQIAGSDTHSAPGQRLGSAKAAPEIMLNKINTLAASGEKNQAQHDYELFIELFPKYEIDFKKYPSVEELVKK